MEKGKSILAAALAGGLTCAVSTLLLMGFLALGVDANNMLLPLGLMLICVCAITGVLFLTGAYSKIEPILGAGALLALTGFSGGMAGMTHGARAAGAGIGGAIKVCWKGFFLLVWRAVLLAVVIGLVGAFIIK